MLVDLPTFLFLTDSRFGYSMHRKKVNPVQKLPLIKKRSTDFFKLPLGYTFP